MTSLEGIGAGFQRCSLFKFMVNSPLVLQHKLEKKRSKNWKISSFAVVRSLVFIGTGSSFMHSDSSRPAHISTRMLFF